MMEAEGERGCVFLQVYCCVGALAIAGQLYRVDADQLGWWLCERQLPSGGLNGNYTFYVTVSLPPVPPPPPPPPLGRPEKLPDVCYSWWVLSSLAMIGRLHWIDKVSSCYI